MVSTTFAVRMPWRLLITLLLLAGCRPTSQSTWQERPDFEAHYEAAGVTGTFVLYDMTGDAYLVYNPTEARTPYIPASTFKIFNSLVALETGAIRDADEMIAWDGVERSFEMWNQDHNLRTAIRYSAVWFYQELARRIGPDRMQHWIDAAGYGNQTIDGGIDRFWLDGELAISPVEQVDFLVRLYRDDLPFSQRSMDIVKDILVLEQTDAYVLRGKTGWSQASMPQVGWFVGTLTRGNDVYAFANKVDIVDDTMGGDEQARVQITRQILHDLGLLPVAL